MYYDKHTVRWHKIAYLIIGVTLGALAVWTSVKVRIMNYEVAQYRTIKANVEMTQETEQIAAYIKENNGKVWDKLSEEMAIAYFTASKKYGIPVSILIGKDQTESGFNVFAKSKTGAKGVGQLDHGAWKDVLPEGNPYDPSYNIDSCARVLAFQIKKHGVKKGLEYYNVGEGNYKKGIRNPAYARKVLSAASEFRYRWRVVYAENTKE